MGGTYVMVDMMESLLNDDEWLVLVGAYIWIGVSSSWNGACDVGIISFAAGQGL